jgi:uncharacterized protein
MTVTSGPDTAAQALLNQIEAIARRLPVSPVRALHVPRRAEGQAAHDAEFCAIELEDGRFGLSYVLLGGTLDALLGRHGPATPDAAPLAGADPLILARGLVGGTAVERAIALAAINAMTDSAWHRIGYEPRPAANSLGDVQLTADDHLGMIGFFPPLVGRIQAAGGRLTVVELDAATVARQQLRYPSVHITLDRAALVDCNVVVGTSTMLLNDTLDEMLAAAHGAHRFAIIGPSAGPWPDTLFDRGVTLMGGTRVVDGAAFVEAMRTGRSWGSATRKFAIGRDDWPGWERLLSGRPALELQRDDADPRRP